MFTQVRSSSRRVSPEAADGRAVMRAVYVVLEPQYQNALTQAATSLNAQGGDLAIDLSGYLIEELRDPENYAAFCADVAEADLPGGADGAAVVVESFSARYEVSWP